MNSSFLSPHTGGLYLTVRVRPNASRKGPARLVDTGKGRQAVEIAVKESPRDGKANEALIARLAQELSLKKNAFSIKSGASGRLKILNIDGNPQELASRIEDWLSEGFSS